MRTNSELTIFCSFATSPFSILSSKNAMSSWLLFNRVSKVNFNSRSASVASSLRSAKAITAKVIGGILARAADRHLHDHGGNRRENEHQQRADDGGRRDNDGGL